jgi:hypothetical protein
VDPEKVKGIMEGPVLKNAHEVRSFMGQVIIEDLWRILQNSETHHHFAVQGGQV